MLDAEILNMLILAASFITEHKGESICLKLHFQYPAEFQLPFYLMHINYGK